MDSYPSSSVEIPVHVRAEARCFRKEENGETTVRFVTREDVVVPKGTAVTVPVAKLPASAARAIHEHMFGPYGSGMEFHLSSTQFGEAARTIAAIVEQDDSRALTHRCEAASAKVRRVR